jgi:hypothetical protein
MKRWFSSVARAGVVLAPSGGTIAPAEYRRRLISDERMLHPMVRNGLGYDVTKLPRWASKDYPRRALQSPTHTRRRRRGIATPAVCRPFLSEFQSPRADSPFRRDRMAFPNHRDRNRSIQPSFLLEQATRQKPGPLQ